MAIDYSIISEFLSSLDKDQIKALKDIVFNNCLKSKNCSDAVRLFCDFSMEDLKEDTNEYVKDLLTLQKVVLNDGDFVANYNDVFTYLYLKERFFNENHFEYNNDAEEKFIKDNLSLLKGDDLSSYFNKLKKVYESNFNLVKKLTFLSKENIWQSITTSDINNKDIYCNYIYTLETINFGKLFKIEPKEIARALYQRLDNSGIENRKNIKSECDETAIESTLKFLGDNKNTINVIPFEKFMNNDTYKYQFRKLMTKNNNKIKN
jgi:hypothetical protein